MKLKPLQFLTPTQTVLQVCAYYLQYYYYSRDPNKSQSPCVLIFFLFWENEVFLLSSSRFQRYLYWMKLNYYSYFVQVIPKISLKRDRACQNFGVTCQNVTRRGIISNFCNLSVFFKNMLKFGNFTFTLSQ